MKIKEIKGGVGLAIQIAPNKIMHYLIDEIPITNNKMNTLEIFQRVGSISMNSVFQCKLCEDTKSTKDGVTIRFYKNGKQIQKSVCHECLNQLNQGVDFK